MFFLVVIHLYFRRYYYRGKEVPKLLDLSDQEMHGLYASRQRRNLRRGRVMPEHLMKRLQKAVRYPNLSICLYIPYTLLSLV